MDEHGLPPDQDTVWKIADILLSHQNPGLSTGKNWVSNFIKWHDNLISKYMRKYDYQRAKCKDPEVIN
jgi:hypothetical protein